MMATWGGGDEDARDGWEAPARERGGGSDPPFDLDTNEHFEICSVQQVVEREMPAKNFLKEP